MQKTRILLQQSVALVTFWICPSRMYRDTQLISRIVGWCRTGAPGPRIFDRLAEAGVGTTKQLFEFRQRVFKGEEILQEDTRKLKESIQALVYPWRMAAFRHQSVQGAKRECDARGAPAGRR